jgi:hypothetical protein
MQSQRVDIQLKMPEILFKSFHPLTLSLKRMKAKLYMEQQTARVVVLDYAVLLAAALVPVVQVALVVVVAITLAVVRVVELALVIVKAVVPAVMLAVRQVVPVAVGMMAAPVTAQLLVEWIAKVALAVVLDVAALAKEVVIEQGRPMVKVLIIFEGRI